MSWWGAWWGWRPKHSKAEAKANLPPGACKVCVHYYRVCGPDRYRQFNCEGRCRSDPRARLRYDGRLFKPYWKYLVKRGLGYGTQILWPDGTTTYIQEVLR